MAVLLVELLCYQAFSVPRTASCWMTPVDASLASKRQLTTDCTQGSDAAAGEGKWLTLQGT